jgi:glycosyltransferase involved in cell wall biosynthesis
VTTRGAECEEPFLDGENVVLCPPRDAAALAAAMARLIAEPALRAHLRTGIAAMSKEWFSWETSIDRTIAAFRIAAPASRPIVAADPVGLEALGPR